MSHNTRKRKKKKKKNHFDKFFSYFTRILKLDISKSLIQIPISHSTRLPFQPCSKRSSKMRRSIAEEKREGEREEKKIEEREEKKKKRTIESERISQLPSMSLTPHAWSICRKTSRPYKYPLQRIIFSSPHRTREICLFSRTVEINSTIVSTREGEGGGQLLYRLAAINGANKPGFVWLEYLKRLMQLAG